MNGTQEQSQNQEEIIAFLSRPISYEYRPDSVEIVQTHASIVALAGGLVFKVKKEVDFGFLDFSTLEKRYHFCQEEIRLNSRLSPLLYVEIRPIHRTQEGLSFRPEGPIVEYALVMRRLDEEGILKNILVRSELSEVEVDSILTALADQLARFYQEIPLRAEVSEWGDPGHIRISTEENFRQLEPYAGQIFPAPALYALRYYTNLFLETHSELLESRIREGRILEGHGDLHLEHIHVGRDGITIFDCIEFNERFRYLDVASDIAFLAMDLDFNGQSHLSRQFGSLMAERLRDPHLFPLLDFYKCYRAVVRGKVNCFVSSEREVPENERVRAAERAQGYLRLALGYAVAGSHPILLAMSGRPGTGKSALARRLQAALGPGILSSDHIRKELSGLPLFERPDPETRTRIYSREMTERTYDTLLRRAEERLKHGCGSILDATFSSKEHRSKLRQLAESYNARILFIETTAGDATIRERLGRRDTHTDEVSDARLEDFEMLSSRYHPLSEVEGSAHISVNTEGTHEETLSSVLEEMVRRNK